MKVRHSEGSWEKEEIKQVQSLFKEVNECFISFSENNSDSNSIKIVTNVLINHLARICVGIKNPELPGEVIVSFLEAVRANASFMLSGDGEESEHTGMLH